MKNSISACQTLRKLAFERLESASTGGMRLVAVSRIGELFHLRAAVAAAAWKCARLLLEGDESHLEQKRERLSL